MPGRQAPAVRPIRCDRAAATELAGAQAESQSRVAAALRRDRRCNRPVALSGSATVSPPYWGGCLPARRAETDELRARLRRCLNPSRSWRQCTTETAFRDAPAPLRCERSADRDRGEPRYEDGRRGPQETS